MERKNCHLPANYIQSGLERKLLLAIDSIVTPVSDDVLNWIQSVQVKGCNVGTLLNEAISNMLTTSAVFDLEVFVRQFDSMADQLLLAESLKEVFLFLLAYKNSSKDHMHSREAFHVSVFRQKLVLLCGSNCCFQSTTYGNGGITATSLSIILSYANDTVLMENILNWIAQRPFIQDSQKNGQSVRDGLGIFNI